MAYRFIFKRYKNDTGVIYLTQNHDKSMTKYEYLIEVCNHLMR